MKNEDKPAMPIDGEALNDSPSLCLEDSTGLTKREMFAMHAMQGLLSANATYSGKTNDRIALARDAIAHADSLLAELEKQQ